jgi:hypothetical protein
MRLKTMSRLPLLLVSGVLAACGSTQPSNSKSPTVGCSPIRVSAAPFFDAGPIAFGTPPKQLTATVTSETRAPLPDIKIDFSVGGKQIGTATTNAQGIALSEPDGVSIGSEQWTAVHPADTHCAATAAATYTKQP